MSNREAGDWLAVLHAHSERSHSVKITAENEGRLTRRVQSDHVMNKIKVPSFCFMSFSGPLCQSITQSCFMLWYQLICWVDLSLIGIIKPCFEIVVHLNFLREWCYRDHRLDVGQICVGRRMQATSSANVPDCDMIPILPFSIHTYHCTRVICSRVSNVCACRAAVMNS